MKLSIIILLSIGLFISNQKPNIKALPINAEKQEAFNVLSNKCNVCHSSKNPSKVFTLKNMNEYASKINRQVFVWRRMPKGNEIKLTNQEKQILKKWLNNQLNK